MLCSPATGSPLIPNRSLADWLIVPAAVLSCPASASLSPLQWRLHHHPESQRDGTHAGC
jgi:hypothetical protein